MLWTWAVFGFALLATLTGLYLSFRQQRSVAANRQAVPHRFAEKVSLAAHQKAADYTAAKLRLGVISSIWGLLLLLVWTVGGGLAWLGDLTASFELSLVWSGVALMLLFFLIGTLIDLPMEIYGTFAIEARFGFNKMTLPLFFSDMGKQLVLMLLIGTPLAWVILTLMQSAGDRWWLYAWLFWTAFMLLMMWGYPTLIAPLFNK